MLQQTPVKRVVPRLAGWLERWPVPAALAAASPSDAVRQWANLGYPRRALRLHQAAVVIRDRHGGVVPRELDDLLTLAGVGEYTARAVAAFAYGERHPVVDTNTRRVLARALDGRAGSAPSATRDLKIMAGLLPSSAADAAVMNAATMELGAVICIASTPRCGRCPIAEDCAWRLAGYPDTGDQARRQPAYQGSDRQARGAVLKVLREHDSQDVSLSELRSAWPDLDQLNRALASLIADGLAQSSSGGKLRLPA